MLLEPPYPDDTSSVLQVALAPTSPRGRSRGQPGNPTFKQLGCQILIGDLRHAVHEDSRRLAGVACPIAPPRRRCCSSRSCTRDTVGVSPHACQGLIPIPSGYRSAFIQSATRSAIIIVVALVFARITSGITEASTTRSPSRPWMWQNWSTTAIGSEAGPILHVPAE